MEIPTATVKGTCLKRNHTRVEEEALESTRHSCSLN